MKSEPLDIRNLRDRLHNLDLKNKDHLAVYNRNRAAFLSESEKPTPYAYDDENSHRIKEGVQIIGNVTVGIGFNMSRDKENASRNEWKLAFNGTVDFDAVKAGDLTLTKEQIDKLFQVSLDMRVKELRNHYSRRIWEKLRPNERLAIESAYYNRPSLVRRNSGFHENMCLYYTRINKDYLLKAVYQLRNRSNKEGSIGLQRRRNKEAELLDSTKCPLYADPNSVHCPRKPLTAIIGKTVLPRGVDDWGKPETVERYYIWRTKMDEKVRPHHAAREGKVYDAEDTSILHPKEEANCRCYGVPVPYTIALARTDRKSYYNPMTASLTLRH